MKDSELQELAREVGKENLMKIVFGMEQVIKEEEAKDKMKKYKDSVTILPKVVGGTIIGMGLLIDSSACAVGGSALFLGGYVMDAVDYIKGYFNERLNLLEQETKAGDLEKKIGEPEVK